MRKHYRHILFTCSVLLAAGLSVLSYAHAPAFTPPIELGDSHAGVRTLQQFLNTNGSMAAEAGAASRDNNAHFGANTIAKANTLVASVFAVVGDTLQWIASSVTHFFTTPLGDDVLPQDPPNTMRAARPAAVSEATTTLRIDTFLDAVAATSTFPMLYVGADLDVRRQVLAAGDARIAGALSVGHSLAVADHATFDGSVTAPSMRTGDLSVTRSASVKDDVDVGGDLSVHGRTAVDGAADIRGPTTMRGAATTTGILAAVGGITTKGANIDVGTGSVYGSNLVYAIKNGKNISIDSTNPAHPVISARASGGGGSRTVIQSGSGTVGGGTAGQIPYYAGDGTTVTGSSALYVDALGDLELGTTSPGYKLTVAGTASVTGDATLADLVPQVTGTLQPGPCRRR